jgi:hypothetical protein
MDVLSSGKAGYLSRQRHSKVTQLEQPVRYSRVMVREFFRLGELGLVAVLVLYPLLMTQQERRMSLYCKPLLLRRKLQEAGVCKVWQEVLIT